MDEQNILIQIVRTWKLNEKPEFRGFRCGNCQDYINKAWYHFLNSDGYLLPIHLCDDKCEKVMREGALKVDKEKIVNLDIQNFGKNHIYSEKTTKRFEEIVLSWEKNRKPELKNFTCDECGNDLDIDPKDGQRKGYHTWWKMSDGKTLAELHFHKTCGDKLEIDHTA